MTGGRVAPVHSGGWSPTEAVESGTYDALSDAVQARNEANSRITVLISQMRQNECPWSVIGDVLGVSKQAAQKKYGSSRVSLVDRPLRTSD